MKKLVLCSSLALVLAMGACSDEEPVVDTTVVEEGKEVLDKSKAEDAESHAKAEAEMKAQEKEKEKEDASIAQAYFEGVSQTSGLMSAALSETGTLASAIANDPDIVYASDYDEVIGQTTDKYNEVLAQIDSLVPPEDFVDFHKQYSSTATKARDAHVLAFESLKNGDLDGVNRAGEMLGEVTEEIQALTVQINAQGI